MAPFHPEDLPEDGWIGSPQLREQIDAIRERVREIEAKALRQLQSQERARHLRTLLSSR